MMDNELNDRESAVLQKIATDYQYCAERCMYVKTKDGKLEKFKFNKAQMHLHTEAETQLKMSGMVRIIGIKGRQQGFSTYVEGRFSHKSFFKKNKTVFILSHEAKSTAALFGKAETFYRTFPEQIRPGLVSNNRTTLEFDNGSRYIVGTAGATSTGRSETAQYFHGSEVGYFENPEAIASGALQTVADIPGTEIFLESTGNGRNWLYKITMDALAGRSLFKVVFVPWFWQDEYRTKVPEGFQKDEQEKILAQTYGLDDEQIYWRRLKIVSLGSERLFRQEYPNTLMEAFQESGDRFYDADDVARAMSSKLKPDKNDPIVLGVDPARTGDRTVLVLRQGRVVRDIWVYDHMDTMLLTGIVSKKIREFDVDMTFIDYGLGYGTVDRLKELGFGHVVTGVHFSAKPADKQYLNKRAEMAFAFRDWLKDGEVRLPNSDDMAVDIGAMPDFKINSNGKLHFAPKDDIKEELGRSPDILDAIMLTFAYPVRSKAARAIITSHTKNTSGGSQLKTLARIRGPRKGKETDIWD